MDSQSVEPGGEPIPAVLSGVSGGQIRIPRPETRKKSEVRSRKEAVSSRTQGQNYPAGSCRLSSAPAGVVFQCHGPPSSDFGLRASFGFRPSVFGVQLI